jgi:hypothetical protein
MADVLLNIEEASRQLQMTKEQVAEMVKKGLLRGFLDQKTYKFRPADIEAYKKKVASGATTVEEGAPRKDSTSKIDLTEVESDANVEDSDQTSVLAAAKGGEVQEKPPEKPVFKFGEKDLALHEEQAAALEEGDQTSLLVPSIPSAEKGKPSVDFAKKDLKLPDEAGDSVLVADESESSMDILEVAEESSESGSSASRISFSDEVTSGDEIETAAESASKLAQKPPPKVREPSSTSTDKVVTDILGPAPEESSDEALETIEVDEAVVETREPSSTGIEAEIQPEAPEPEAPEPEAAVTAPVADEHETAAILAADETKAALGGEETKAAVGEAGEAAETAGVDGAVAEALQEQAGVEEEPAAEEEGAAILPGAWETVQSWPTGNVLLIAATVVLVITGVLLFCEAFNLHNSLTTAIANAVGGQGR